MDDLKTILESAPDDFLEDTMKYEDQVNNQRYVTGNPQGPKSQTPKSPEEALKGLPAPKDLGSPNVPPIPGGPRDIGPDDPWPRTKPVVLENPVESPKSPEQALKDLPAPKDLGSMGDHLNQTAVANQLTTPIRTLRVRNAFQSAIANRPSELHPGAMEVVVTGGDEPNWRAAVDYVPAMGGALFDSKSTTSLQGSGGLRAFAPVKNSWGETIGVAEVSVRSTPPIWSLALRLVPAVRLLALRWPVHLLRRAWRALEEPIAAGLALPGIAAAATALCVWRREEQIHERPIDTLEAEALRTLADGIRFGALCERIAARVGDDEAPARAAGWLARWVEDGLVAAADR